MSIGIRLDLQPVIADVCSPAIQVEIGVVGQVYQRGPVGCCIVFDHQCRSFDAVCHRHIEVRRIALFSVRRVQGKGHAVLCCVCHREGPEGKALLTPVIAVGTVVHRELICGAFQREPSLADAVGCAADDGTEIAFVCFVIRQGFVSKHHILPVSVSVTDTKGKNCGAQIHERCTDLITGQRDQDKSVPCFSFDHVSPVPGTAVRPGVLFRLSCRPLHPRGPSRTCP